MSALSRNPGGVQRSGSTRGSFGGGEKCSACGKTVYLQERISEGQYVFHEKCFTCAFPGCGKKLTSATFNTHHGKILCPPHYKEEFEKDKQQAKYFASDEAPPATQGAPLNTGLLRASTSKPRTTGSRRDSASLDPSTPTKTGTLTPSAPSDHAHISVHAKGSTTPLRSVAPVSTPKKEQDRSPLPALRKAALPDEPPKSSHPVEARSPVAPRSSLAPKAPVEASPKDLYDPFLFDIEVDVTTWDFANFSINVDLDFENLSLGF
eukprot:TRINITY_DN8873_c0_g1_i1.p1 TRINITY_DN8873_c0_g1~~TRINITY_DN8873_c0_g1_i1.p1  ORF type:complete len:264 (-),score=32.28 TRINITY_DN8873_c0_g1_i1:52-843(-)